MKKIIIFIVMFLVLANIVQAASPLGYGGNWDYNEVRSFPRTKLDLSWNTWDSYDKALFCTWMSTRIVDYGQTNYCIHHSETNGERNELINDLTDRWGRDATLPYFIAGSILGYLVANAMPSGKLRKALLLSFVFLQGRNCVFNACGGCGVRF